MKRKLLVNLLMILIAAAAVVASLEFSVTQVRAATPYDVLENSVVTYRTKSDNFTSYTLTRNKLYEQDFIDKNNLVGIAHQDIPTIGSVGQDMNYCVPTPGLIMNVTYGAIDGNKIPFTIYKDDYLSWWVYLSLEPFFEWWIVERITLGEDAHGILYIENTTGCDVDIFMTTTDTTGAKVGPTVTQIGDGKLDGAGSMYTNMSTHYELWIGTTKAMIVDSVFTTTTGDSHLTVVDTSADGRNEWHGLTATVNGTPMIPGSPWTHTSVYTGAWLNVPTGPLIYGNLDSWRTDNTCLETADPIYPSAGFVPTAYWDLTEAMAPVNIQFYRAHIDPTISPYGDGAFWVGETVHFEARSTIGVGSPWFPPWDSARNVTQWEWDFDGDGSWDWTDDGSHTSPEGGGLVYYQYDEPGLYYPKVRVTTADAIQVVYVMNTTMYPLPLGLYSDIGIQVLDAYGDTDDNDDVDFWDLMAIAAPGVYDEVNSATTYPERDINGNGHIDFWDLMAVAAPGIYDYVGSGSGLVDGPGFTAP